MDRNTIEYLGIWEKIHNPNFNYGEFAIIESQAGLNKITISQMKILRSGDVRELETNGIYR